VPGASGFVINTSQGNVVYTGDLRTHGAKPELTREFVDKAKEAEPVAVVTEATNMASTSISSEKEVEDKLSCIVGQAEGIVLAEFAYADIDCLNSFFGIAKKNGRCLAVSLRQAYLLDALRADKGLTVPNLNDENVLISRKSKERRDKWENQVLE
jgi:ribonuclease J